jgi:hypothetical protein
MHRARVEQSGLLRGQLSGELNGVVRGEEWVLKESEEERKIDDD